MGNKFLGARHGKGRDTRRKIISTDSSTSSSKFLERIELINNLMQNSTGYDVRQITGLDVSQLTGHDVSQLTGHDVTQLTGCDVTQIT